MDKLTRDERIDPRIRAWVKSLGGGGDVLLRVNVESHAAVAERMQETLMKRLENIPKPVPPPAEVRALWSKNKLNVTTEAYTTPEGNVCKMLLILPKAPGPHPCVYYLHGGGMVVGSAFQPDKVAWARLLANQGVAVAVPDFRNAVLPSSLFGAGGGDDVAQYPGGLLDCLAGLEYVHAHAARLGVGRVVVAGESGGGNLTVALALKVARLGRHQLLAGWFSLCPCAHCESNRAMCRVACRERSCPRCRYIAGAWPQDEENSDVLGCSHLDAENNGVFLNLGGNTAAMGYSLAAFAARDPLAWRVTRFERLSPRAAPLFSPRVPAAGRASRALMSSGCCRAGLA
jgi:acetyl esterase/lipase